MMPRDSTRVRRAAATVAMVGVVLYVLIDVVLQFLPPHYSAISDAESNLAVGPFGWIMSINFFGRAILSTCAIIAIALTGGSTTTKRAGMMLFGVAGVCSGALAFFPTDIHTGGGISTTTTSGAIHVTLATSGFLSAFAAFLVLTRWIRWTPELASTHRAAAVFVWVAAAGLASLALTIVWFNGLLGLAERVCLAGILGWAFVVSRGIRALR